MQIRPYQHEEDFVRIYDFLAETYQPVPYLKNWLPSRWEYMHFHPVIWELDRSKYAIAHENDRICGIVHNESTPAEVFLQVRPGYEHLKAELLDYAEQNGYRAISHSRNKPFRVVFVNEFEQDFEQEVQARGYEKWAEFGDVHSLFRFDRPIPTAKLPKGFALQSLADENDLHKINRVLWRGFNHEGDPPEEEIPGRAFGQQAPHFRTDLTIVAVDPAGQYVSYCGMYYDERNRAAYLEPLATDPAFRRMGLATAVIYESMRRVSALGAELCWVGSGLEVYRAVGFEVRFTVYPWAMILE
jgi:predicted N-acetyltransferase YhbS